MSDHSVRRVVRKLTKGSPLVQYPTHDQFGRRRVNGYHSPSFMASELPNGHPRLMLIGEAPGYHEDRSGRPFVGETGKEMARLLKQAGLSIASFFLTNVVKYRPFTSKATGNTAPTLADIKRDEGDLIDEIDWIRPEWILAVGRIAARWLFNVDELDIEDYEGFAYPNIERACGATVIVARHPAAGFHSPEQQPLIYWDFQRAGQFIRGEIEAKPPVDEFPDAKKNYHLIKHKLSTPPRGLKVAVDTEGVIGSEWCLTYSVVPGTAGMILNATDGGAEGIEYAKEIINNNVIGIHNSPWDLRIIANLLGLPLLDLLYSIKFEDTMQMAYVLRLLPKGLKALGRRFKGVDMVSYQSVVAEADSQIMSEWLKGVLRRRCKTCKGQGTLLVQPTSEKTGKLLAERLVNCTVCEGDGTRWLPPDEKLNIKKGKVSVSRGHRMGWRIRNILKDLKKVDPETGEKGNPRKRWEALKGKDYEFAIQVEERLGAPKTVTLGDIPFKRAKEYACLDSDVTKRVWPDLEAELDREGLRKVYELDKSVIPMVTRMMDVGWKIDTNYLNRLTNKLTVQQDKLLYKLEQLVGRPINPNSSEQVGEVLFGEMGLHPVKLTDSGAESTDSKVLSDLRILANSKAETSSKYLRAYEFISGVLEYKERGKLKSTYTLPLPRLVDKESRLHTTFKLAAVESGRLASAEPNLQNIPSKTILGKLIRRAFIVEPGRTLVGVDLAQIEMRVLAHLSGDKTLIRGIKRGLDVHALTTSKIFGIPYESVTHSMWQRDAAKILGFGLVYGISASALKTQIKLQSGKHMKGGVDIPVEQCQQWINEYTKTTYPGVGYFMSDSQADARRVGYVESMFGRRRYLPGVHSPINKVRAESERIATNHRIQATAADIEKMAMAAIWEEVLPKFRRRGYTECILQEHDALFFETETKLADELLVEVIRVKCEVVRLRVPVLADGHVGVNWAQVKEGDKYVA